MRIERIPIQTRSTEIAAQGSLSFFEAERDVPFIIKRIYYIYGVSAGIQRGGHAHKQLRQMLWCPYGRIRVTLDDGRERKQILLDRPDSGLLVGPGLWREMVWEQDGSVLCVAASEHYDAEDYIRDYRAFLQYAASREGL